MSSYWGIVGLDLHSPYGCDRLWIPTYTGKIRIRAEVRYLLKTLQEIIKSIEAAGFSNPENCEQHIQVY